MNAAKVPQLFVGSGATTFSRDYRRYPQTIGFLPSYVGEGKVYARHILRTKPNARDRRALPERRLRQGPPQRLQGRSRWEAAEHRRRAGLRPALDGRRLPDGASQGLRRPRVVADRDAALHDRGLVAANRLGWRPQVASIRSGARRTSCGSSPRQRDSASSRTRSRSSRSRIRPRRASAATRGCCSTERSCVATSRGATSTTTTTYSMAVAYTFERALRRAGGTRRGRRSLAGGREPEHPEQPVPPARREDPYERRGRFPIDQGQLQRWSRNQWNPRAK